MNSYIESFLELIYPEKNICAICGTYDNLIGEKYICPQCDKSLQRLIPPLCIKCSKPINYESSINLCPDCLAYEKYFESGLSLYSYDGLIKKCIRDYKYHNKPYLFKFLGGLLLECINSYDYKNYDYILSVPLSNSKLRTRGYNQSELLARFVAKRLNKPYADALKRVKNTVKQSSSSREDRIRNLKDAFAIKNSRNTCKIKNKSILLVDDIYTTGATVNECTRVLLEYGVSKVYVITAAR